MPVLKLNIGLNVAGKPTLNAAAVCREVITEFKPFIAGPRFFNVQTAASGEETVTAAIIVQRIGDVELNFAIHRLCDMFQQDCIAGIYGKLGFLIGPNTADYGGEFNAEYWLEPVELDYKLVAIRDLIDAFDLVCSESAPLDGRSSELIKAAGVTVNAIRAQLRSLAGV